MAGNTGAGLRCPYHAWTYDLDSNLSGTPHVGGTGVHELEGFCKSGHGLHAVPGCPRSRVASSLPSSISLRRTSSNRWRGHWQAEREISGRITIVPSSIPRRSLDSAKIAQ